MADSLDSKVVTFGRYKGMTIAEIRVVNPNYLYYLSDSEFYKEELPKLDEPVINFGKYNGKTYKSVKTEDPQYFEWLRKSATNIYTKAKIAYITGTSKAKKKQTDIDSLEIS